MAGSIGQAALTNPRPHVHWSTVGSPSGTPGLAGSHAALSRLGPWRWELAALGGSAGGHLARELLVLAVRLGTHSGPHCPPA